MEQKVCSCDARPALIGPDDAPTEPHLVRFPDSSQHIEGPAVTAIADTSDSYADEELEYSPRFAGEPTATHHSNR
jgi:hypothetical protein